MRFERLYFGGSFNPPHVGHLTCGRAARAAVGAGKLVLVPSAGNPLKRGYHLAPAADRVAMCRLAAGAWEDVEVDDREAVGAPPSYTLRTTRALIAAGAERPVRWLIGADLLPTLPRWWGYGEMRGELAFVAMSRAGEVVELESLPEVSRSLVEDVVRVPDVDVSATRVREALRAGGKVGHLVAPGVARYLCEKQLYV